MARCRSKKKSSNKLLKTAILLILFIGLWFIYNHTDIPARIQNALRPHKPTTVQTVPEPEVTPPKQQTGGLPPPEPVVTPPSTKNVTYTIKNPQFDNLSYGIPGVADSIVEREGYALGYIEKHEQPAWVQYIMTADEVSRRAAKRGDDFRPDPEIPTGSATPQDYTRSGYDRGHLAPAADMSFSGKTMSESFYMSNNVAPGSAVLPGYLEQAGEASPAFRNEGETDRRGDRADPPDRKDHYHRSKPGYRAAVLLQGHLRYHARKR